MSSRQASPAGGESVGSGGGDGDAEAAAPAVRPKAGPDGKLQQLLGLARDRLQKQQRVITARDATIADLRSQVAARRAPSPVAKREAAPRSPGRALAVVLEKTVFPGGGGGGGRWVLVEYEDDDGDDGSDEPLEWVHFASQQALNDFVRRDPGREPIDLPDAALPPAEARRLASAARADVAAAEEAFRGYRIEAELRLKRSERALEAASASRVRDDASALDARRAALLAAAAPDPAPPAAAVDAAVASLTRELAAARAENAALSGAGGDASLAGQWRRRYEQCAADRDAAREEARLLKAPKKKGADYAALAAARDELDAEYRLYRANARAALEAAGSRGGGAPGAAAAPTHKQLEALGRRGPAGGGGSRRAGRGAGAGEDKIAYLKNLMTKYLSSSEPSAKAHMERAVMMVLGYTAEEKSRILADRAASESWLPAWPAAAAPPAPA